MRTVRQAGWILLLYAANVYAAQVTGYVRDAAGGPIAGAMVTLGDNAVNTSKDGAFHVTGEGTVLYARAAGYERAQTDLARMASPANFALRRFHPKALYLTVYGVGAPQFRDNALKLIETTELNALVVDLKGDAGIVPYPSKVPEVTAAGTRKLTSIPSLAGFAAQMHARGIYLIGRIVVFKDNPLALCRHDLAVKTAGGAVWRDREGLAWVDPFRQEVRDYNLAIAEEAAQAGFDEIQFDYMRFPDAAGLRFAEESTTQSREAAIALFFRQARQRLARYNVFLAADIFGYVCWNVNDTGIGQHLETLAPQLDYVSPMLYPSGFQYGIPGFRNPVSHPFEIVYRSLERARERTGLPSLHFRPWLQSFADYGFDRRPFGAEEIGEQIRGAEQAGSDGWMLWNARNRYSSAGLKAKR